MSVTTGRGSILEGKKLSLLRLGAFEFIGCIEVVPLLLE